jgi:hypothetical protein
VLAKKTESMDVFAEPDGTYTAKLYPGPIGSADGEIRARLPC